jgi:hypothetical protein
VGRGKGGGREGKEQGRGGEGKGKGRGGEGRGEEEGGGLDPPNFETVVAPLLLSRV